MLDERANYRFGQDSPPYYGKSMLIYIVEDIGIIYRE